MISAKPTENLAGITIEGDHDDFYEIMEWEASGMIVGSIPAL